MSREEDIDYDALDEISKKYDMVLEAFENQKVLTLTASIKPSLAALKNELEGVDGLNDSFLNSLIAQHLKALDDQYLIDDKIKQYLRTFIQELADELRSVYSKVKQMEIGLQGSKIYQAQKKIEHDEDGIGVELEQPAQPIPKIVTAKISNPKKEPTDKQLNEAMEDARKPKKKEVSGTDKSKLVQAAYINLPKGTRTLSNLIQYIRNNYRIEVKRSSVAYHCNIAGLELEGQGGSPSHASLPPINKESNKLE